MKQKLGQAAKIIGALAIFFAMIALSIWRLAD